MSKTKIHPDMKVADIIRQWPEAREVFQANGLGALVSKDGLRALAPFLSLGTALRSRFMNPEAFTGLLGSAMEQKPVQESPGLESMAGQRDLTLLGLMPCGLKMPFSRAFADFMARVELDGPIQFAVEGNLNQELSYYSYVHTIEDPDELPDIIVSSDFNIFYGHRFNRQFVAPGHFTGYGCFQPGTRFVEAGIPDPKGEYSILCVNPLVMVVNLDQLGDRPLPRTWADCLDPIWKNSLTIRGGDQFFCHAVLLPIFQQFGPEGLRALAANLARGLHPSQMVARMDKNSDGAVYVMPEFFAQRVRHQERIQIIWPEDGALASPVTLQVKPDRIPDLKPVLDYLTGPGLAATLAHARFPVPHAGIQADVQTRPLRWLGWDYLRKNDLVELNQEIDEIFMPLAPVQG
ncbi:ABC transporter substrate-binding protein [Desulfospira joergensenii]|uniref:ABC transporter substrate-binding protein n=1 Tax=Desulfospira joergensenii TaxID=53329 RepID=UPI0003B314A7|nr:ABC transporter substrate-binding protein [Desulfospira joergensenii]